MVRQSKSPAATGEQRYVALLRGVNVCHPEPDPSSDIDYDLYETVLHEIGHALGLSNAGNPLDYLNYGSYDRYVISHPTIPDSVLNYDPRGLGPGQDEPNCSPYPFDVMAIYALYQNMP